MEEIYLLEIEGHPKNQYKLIGELTFNWLGHDKFPQHCPKIIADGMWETYKNDLLKNYPNKMAFMRNITTIQITGYYFYDIALLAPPLYGKTFENNQ